MINDITAIILTKNEELNIERCINSIKGLADRICVVDSGSVDRTVEIASRLNAEIFNHPFEHYAAQFNWALDNLNINTKWVYRIDADEMITKELEKEIIQQCKAHHDDDVNAFLMKHKLFFLGRYLKHGGTYPFKKITIFKPEFGRFENRAMGEHIVLSKGRIIELQNDCIHYDFKSIDAFVDKHNKYATREVTDYYYRSNFKQENLYKEAEFSKKIRDSFYYKLPKFVRAKMYYWYRYYVLLGFLDGAPGRIYAFIQAYMYRYLVDAKIYEEEYKRKLNN